MSHHYDDHDHDKLLRWRDDLQANAIIDGEFPAMALVPGQAPGDRLPRNLSPVSHRVRTARRQLRPSRDLRHARSLIHRAQPPGAYRPVRVRPAGDDARPRRRTCIRRRRPVARRRKPRGRRRSLTATAPATTLRPGRMLSTVSASPSADGRCVSWASRAANWTAPTSATSRPLRCQPPTI